METLFEQLLADLDPAPRLEVRDIVSWLLGMVVQQQARPLAETELDEEIGNLCRAVLAR